MSTYVFIVGKAFKQQQQQQRQTCYMGELSIMSDSHTDNQQNDKSVSLTQTKWFDDLMGDYHYNYLS